jgi:hypothetical protein
MYFPDFVPSISFKRQGDYLKTNGLGRLVCSQNFGIQVKSVGAPSFPTPAGKGGDFFFSFFASQGQLDPAPANVGETGHARFCSGGSSDSCFQPHPAW